MLSLSVRSSKSLGMRGPENWTLFLYQTGFLSSTAPNLTVLVVTSGASPPKSTDKTPLEKDAALSNRSVCGWDNTSNSCQWVGFEITAYPLLGEAALSRGSHPFDRDSCCRARQTSGVDDMIMSIMQSNRARLHLERNRERNSAILNEGDLGS
jgi:hypothetical protein